MMVLPSSPSGDTADEIPRLIEVLLSTERRLVELTADEVDAVAGSDGRMFLLQRAQEQMRSRETAKQEAILNALPANIALLDAEGRIVSVNEAWSNFSRSNAIQGPGYDIGLNYLEICENARGDHAGEAHKVAAGIRLVLTGESSSFSVEYRCETSTEQRWFLLTVTPFMDSQLQGAVTMHLDITQRKKAENALRESNEKFNQLVDNITDVFWVRSPDMREVYYISPAFERVWGRSVASLYANPQEWPDFILPEDREWVVNEFAGLTRDGSTLDIEYRITRPSGEIRWVHARGFQIRDASSRPIRQAGIVTDITERKWAESRLASLSERTERRERLLTTTLSSLNDFAYSFDRDGRFLFANQPLLKLWGRTSEEVQGKNFFDLGYPSDLARQLQREVRQVLETGETLIGETPYISPAGVQGFYEYIFSPAHAPDGTVDFVVGSTRDITARKRLEEQLRQAHKMEAIGTLAGGIAHDFNNILAAIGGYTELAQLTLTGNPGVRESLEAVSQAVKRAADLVRQILTVGHEQPPTRKAILLQPVVAECIRLLRANTPPAIELELTVAPDAPTVLADETQIHQILMNLGVNARHAMKGRPGRIEMNLERCVVDEVHAAVQPQLRPGLYARVSVSDTGCGMDSTTLKRIFEPFFTTKATGEGTGLGLAVVHGIMDSHDGAITVYSHLGEGTVFHLYFPANTGDAVIAAADSGSVPRGHGERVLFVDDEDLLVRLGEKTLLALGYEVEIVTKPEVALALVRADPMRFALVITDQAMPGMNGLQLAKEIQSVRADLPVILTTGYSLTLTAERIAAAGIRQLLPKPTSIQSLGIAVNAELSRKPLTTHG
jgi:PAS domain S-box-containing protein